MGFWKDDYKELEEVDLTYQPSRWERFSQAFLYGYTIELYKLTPIVLLIAVASFAIGYYACYQYFLSLIFYGGP